MKGLLAPCLFLLWTGYTLGGNKPNPSNVLHVNGPTTGAVSVTILGADFVYADSSGSIRTGKTACPAHRWVTDSHVVCKAAAAHVLSSLNMVVSAGSGNPPRGTQMTSFTFDSPELSLFNYPTSGAVSVTVIGVGFRSTQGSSVTVRVGGTASESTDWLSDTCLAGKTSAGPKSSILVRLSVKGMLTATIASKVTYNHFVPSVTNAPSTGSSSVTVLGSSSVMSTARARFGRSAAEVSFWISDTHLTCRAAAIPGVALTVAVTLRGVARSLATQLSFNGATPSSVVMTNLPSTASISVTVLGTAFGRPSRTQKLRMGGTSPEGSVWTSDTCVLAKPPVPVTGAKQTVLTAAVGNQGTQASGMVSFNLGAASSLLSANTPITGAISVTVLGTGLGAATRVAGTASGHTSWLTETSLKCKTFAAQTPAIAQALVATTPGALVTLTRAVTFDVVLSLSSVQRSNVAGTGSSSVTILGSTLGATDSSRRMRVHATACSSSSWVSDTAVLCKSVSWGPGMARISAVATINAGQAATVASILSVDAPTPTGVINRANTPGTGTVSLTVVGMNVRSDARTGRTSCLASSWASDTTMVCKTDRGVGASLTVAVSAVGRRVGTGVGIYTIDLPAQANSFVASNWPATGSISVTILGTSMTSTDVTARQRLGGTAQRASRWFAATAMVLRAPSVQHPGGRILALTVAGGAASSSVNLLSFNAPRPSSLVRANSPSTAATSVTVVGASIGFKVRLGRTAPLATQWHTDTTVVAKISLATNPVTAAAIVASIVSDGLNPRTISLAFSFNSVTLSSVMPGNSPGTGGASVTVLGRNLGLYDSTRPARVHGSASTSTGWASDSVLSLRLISGGSSGLAVAVTAAASVGTLLQVLTFNSLSANTNIANAPTTGSLVVTVLGRLLTQSSSARVGGSACQQTMWLATTSMRSKVAGGSMHSVAAVLTAIGKATATTGTGHTYNAGSVSLGRNAPGTGASSVTVLGANFGLRDRSASLRVGGTGARTSTWGADSSLALKSGAGVGVTAVAVSAVVKVGAVGSAAGIYSHDLPWSSSVMFTNAPSTGSASVTIVGSNAGSVSMSPRSRVSRTNSGATAWVSESSIVARTSLAAGPAGSVSVTTLMLPGTLASVLSLGSALVSSAILVNSVRTAATSVTVLGSNFGQVDLSSRGRIAVTRAETTAWTSASAVSCKRTVTTRFAADSWAAVTTARQALTVTNAFSTDLKLISSEAVTNVPATGGTSVTVVGSNYGAATLASTRARVGGSAYEVTLWVSESSLVSRASLQGGTASWSHHLVLTSSGTSTLTVAVSHDRWAVTPASVPSNAPGTMSTSVTVVGKNVQRADGSPRLRVLRTAAQAHKWISDSALSVKMSMSVGTSTFIFSLAARTISGDSGFTMDIPSPSSLIVMNSATTASTTVTLVGRGFRNRDFTQKARFEPTSCEATIWIAETAVKCKQHAGLKNGFRGALTVGLSFGTGAEGITFDATVTTSSIVRCNGPTSASISLTLIVTNFDSKDTCSKARLGQTGGEVSAWASGTSIKIKTPASLWNNKVIVGSASPALVGSLGSSFSTDLHLIFGVKTAVNSPSTGAVSVTIMGALHGHNDASVANVFGGTRAEASQWVSDSACRTKVAGGQLKHQLIHLSLAVRKSQPVVDLRTETIAVSSVGGLVSDTVTIVQSVLFTGAFTHDVASTIGTPAVSNLPSTGATSVTLLGFNMGQGYRTLGGSGSTTTSVKVGLTVSPASLWSSETSLYGKVNLATFPSVRCIATVGFSVSTATNVYSVDKPVVSSGVAINMPSTGSTSVTIVGRSHGLHMSPGSRIGGTASRDTRWVSDSTITCHGALGVLPGACIVATVGTQSGQWLDAITFGGGLSGSLKSNAPVSGAVTVTLIGISMAALGATLGSRVGYTSPENTKWASDSHAYCKAGAGVDAGHSVAVTIGAGVVPLVSKVFTFETPMTPSASMPSNAPTTGSVSVTLLGYGVGTFDYSRALRLSVTGAETSRWASDSSMRGKVPLTLVALLTVGVSAGVDRSSFSLAMTHSSPRLSSLIATNSPGTGAVQVTVLGRGVGQSGLSIRGRIGGSGCSSSTWVSDSSLVCLRGPTLSVGLPFAMSVIREVGSVSSQISYNAARVNGMSNRNAGTTGAQSVTVVGVSMGRSPRTASVALGGSNSEATRWVTDSSLHAKAPTAAWGTRKDLNAIVSVPAKQETLSNALTYSGPEVGSSVVVSNAPASGAMSVTMVGLGLGLPVSPKTRFGRTQAEIFRWLSDTAIMSKVAAGRSKAHASVSIYPRLCTATGLLSFDSPQPSSLLRVNFPTTGAASITLSGSDFYRVESLSVRLGGTTQEASRWTSDTGIRVKPPAVHGPLIHMGAITLAVASGTITQVFTHEAPGVSGSVGVNTPSTGAVSVTVLGVAFPSHPITGATKLGKTRTESSAWTSSTSVRCRSVAAATAASQRILVTFGLALGTATLAATYNAVALSSVIRVNMAMTGGHFITLAGVGFSGATGATPRARMAGSAAESTLWVAESSLKIKLPNAMIFGTCCVVTAVTRGRTLTSAATYDAAQPIGFHTVGNSAITGSNYVTLVGAMSGPFSSTSRGQVGGTAMEVGEWKSSSSLRCKTPFGARVRRTVVLSTTARFGSLTMALTYNGCLPSSVMRTNGPQTGSISLTLSGAGFSGTDASQVVSVGGSAAEAQHHISDSSVRCKLPHNAHSKRTLSVTVRVNPGTLFHVFSQDLTLSTVIRGNVPTTAATSVTIAGRGMGHQDYSLTFRMGATRAESVAWRSDTALMVKTPSFSSLSRCLTITVSRVRASLTLIFTWASPQVPAVPNSNSPSTGAATVTVYGQGLCSAATSATARVQSSGAETSRWISDSSLSSKSPRGLSRPGSQQKMVLSVVSQSGTSTYAHTYTAPELRYLLHSNSPPTGHTSVTLVGFGLGVQDPSPAGRVFTTAAAATGWHSTTSINCLPPKGVKGRLPASVSVGFRRGTATAFFSYDVKMEEPPLPFETYQVEIEEIYLCDVTVPATTTAAAFNGTTNASTATTAAPTTTTAGTTSTAAPTTSGTTNPNATTLATTPAVTTTAAPTVMNCTRKVNITLEYIAPAKNVTYTYCYDPNSNGTTLNGTLGNGTGNGTNISSATRSRSFRLRSTTGNATSNTTGNATSSNVTLINGTVVASNSSNSTGVVCYNITYVDTYDPNKPVTTLNVPPVPPFPSKAITIGNTTYYVSAAVRSNTPTTASVSLTLSGQAFGPLDSSLAIRFKNTGCEASTWVSDSGIICRAPSGNTLFGHTTTPASVTVSAQTGTAAATFTYDKVLKAGLEAVVLTRSQCNAAGYCSPFANVAFWNIEAMRVNIPATGSLQVTILAADLGQVDYTPRHALGGTQCEDSEWTSDSCLRCKSAAGQKGRRDFALSVQILESSLTQSFSYDPHRVVGPPTPDRRRFNSTLNGSLLNGTMNGTMLNGTNGTTTTAVPNTTTMQAPTTTTTAATTTTTAPLVTTTAVVCNSTTDNCTTPSPTTTPKPTPLPPSVNVTGEAIATLATNGPATGMHSLTMFAYGFGHNDASTRMRVGLTSCETTTWISDSATTCRAASGGATRWVPRMGATLSGAWSYNGARATHAKAANGATTGGMFITLTGSGFGQSQFSARVRVGLSICSQTLWSSDSSVRCKLSQGRNGEGVPQGAAVTMLRAVATSSPIFQYDMPSNVTLTVVGDLATFNVKVFVTKLANFLKMDPSHIIVLEIRAGSVILVVQFKTPDWEEKTEVMVADLADKENSYLGRELGILDIDVQATGKKADRPADVTIDPALAALVVSVTTAAVGAAVGGAATSSVSTSVGGAAGGAGPAAVSLVSQVQFMAITALLGDNETVPAEYSDFSSSFAWSNFHIKPPWVVDSVLNVTVDANLTDVNGTNTTNATMAETVAATSRYAYRQLRHAVTGWKVVPVDMRKTQRRIRQHRAVRKAQAEYLQRRRLLQETAAEEPAADSPGGVDPSAATENVPASEFTCATNQELMELVVGTLFACSLTIIFVFILRSAVGFIVKHVMLYMQGNQLRRWYIDGQPADSKPPPPSDWETPGLLRFPRWEATVALGQYMGLCEASGQAIGSACNEWVIVGGLVIVIIPGGILALGMYKVYKKLKIVKCARFARSERPPLRLLWKDFWGATSDHKTFYIRWVISGVKKLKVLWDFMKTVRFAGEWEETGTIERGYFASKIEPFVGDFHHKSYMYFAFDLMRKFVTGLLLGIGSTTQAAYGMVALFLIDFILLVAFRPFRDRVKLFVEIGTSTARIVVLVALLFSVLGDLERAAAGVMMFFSNCAGTAMNLITSLSQSLGFVGVAFRAIAKGFEIFKDFFAQTFAGWMASGGALSGAGSQLNNIVESAGISSAALEDIGDTIAELGDGEDMDDMADDMDDGGEREMPDDVDADALDAAAGVGGLGGALNMADAAVMVGVATEGSAKGGYKPRKDAKLGNEQDGEDAPNGEGPNGEGDHDSIRKSDSPNDIPLGTSGTNVLRSPGSPSSPQTSRGKSADRGARRGMLYLPETAGGSSKPQEGSTVSSDVLWSSPSEGKGKPGDGLLNVAPGQGGAPPRAFFPGGLPSPDPGYSPRAARGGSFQRDPVETSSMKQLPHRWAGQLPDTPDTGRSHDAWSSEIAPPDPQPAQPSAVEPSTSPDLASSAGASRHKANPLLTDKPSAANESDAAASPSPGAATQDAGDLTLTGFTPMHKGTSDRVLCPDEESEAQEHLRLDEEPEEPEQAMELADEGQASPLQAPRRLSPTLEDAHAPNLPDDDTPLSPQVAGAAAPVPGAAVNSLQEEGFMEEDDVPPENWDADEPGFKDAMADLGFNDEDLTLMGLSNEWMP